MPETIRPAVLMVLLCSCASGAAAPPPATPAVAAEPEPLAAAAASPARTAPEATCTAFARPGVIRRSAIRRAVDAGLGQWLGGVEIEARVGKGRFQGWVVRRLHPDDPCYQQVDIQAGDVVTRVNGKSVEKPEQANEVFTALRTAPAIVVDLQRGGAAHKVKLAIADD